jgi:hypothetical protein
MQFINRDIKGPQILPGIVILPPDLHKNYLQSKPNFQKLTGKNKKKEKSEREA